MKRPTERELLLEALAPDHDLPSGIADRLDAIVAELDSGNRAEAFQKLFEEQSE